MWESRWSASTSARPELLTVFAPWGSTSKISSGSVSRNFQPGESSKKNSFSGVVSTDWCLVDFLVA